MSTDIHHSVPKDGYGQVWSTTCWYASYRMLHAWKHADEFAIKKKLRAVGLDLDSLFLRGLYDDEFIPAASALGMAGWRGSWVGDQNEEMLIHLLATYGPLWAALDWNGNPSVGHAVVIVGYTNVSKAFEVYNPYNATERGNVEVDWLTAGRIKEWIHPSRFSLQAWP